MIKIPSQNLNPHGFEQFAVFLEIVPLCVSPLQGDTSPAHMSVDETGWGSWAHADSVWDLG